MELIICDLSKTYSNGVQALKNLSLEIPKGMFGLLGPNDAGIDVLTQKQDIRKLLGYIPQQKKWRRGIIHKKERGVSPIIFVEKRLL